MTKEIWFCRKCGGTDIRQDATVRYDPSIEDFEIVRILVEVWCEDCMQQNRDDYGDPVFGIRPCSDQHLKND